MQLLTSGSQKEHSEMIRMGRWWTWHWEWGCVSVFHWTVECLSFPFPRWGWTQYRQSIEPLLRSTFMSVFFPLWLSSLLVLGSLYIALGNSDWSGFLDISVSTLKPSGPWLLIPKPLRLLRSRLFSLLNLYQFCRELQKHIFVAQK